MLHPLDLVYICGNKFLLTNGTRASVRLTYRVAGTDESGSVTLRPGSGEDPGHSETELETTERGVLELYQDEDLVARRRNGGTPCGPSRMAFSVAGTAGAPVESGEWTAPFPWPMVAVHLSLLPDGKVLSWGYSGQAKVWNPATRLFTNAFTSSNIFCAGHSFLPNGQLLVAGGNIGKDRGHSATNIFSPAGYSWTASVAMRRGRWYPTLTTLASGDVVILAGKDEASIVVAEPEVWSGGSLRILSGASLALPYYPRAFLAPNGQVFYAGERQTTRYLDPTGSGRWTTVGSRLYGNRDYGAAVMYDDGKILYAGGGRVTSTAETIDLNSAAPSWQWTGSMAFPRRHLNATVLPTGEVLVTGGSSGPAFDDYAQAVHAAEIWSPATGAWRTLASNSVNRTYHSTSILLPDGQILHAGSGDGEGAPNHMDAELFSPPYLFRGPRPEVTAGPSLVGYSTTFSVSTPQPSAITRVSLIRLGSTTHAFDENQRFQWLSFTRRTADLIISAPTEPNRAPPGHYLLFLLNQEGVPSVGRILRIDRVSTPEPPPASSELVMRVSGRIDATRQYMTVVWAGAAGAMVDVIRNGNLIKRASNTGSYTTSRLSTAAGRFVFKVCEAGTTICSHPATLLFSGTTPLPRQLGVAAWADPTRHIKALTWFGLTGARVDVYRNGTKLKTVENSGRNTVTRSFVGAATYVFKVCNAGTTTCSGQATVKFDGAAPPPKVPPVARFSSDCANLDCRFTDRSTDWDGTISQWHWTFGDGSSSALRNPSHSYATGGNYTVTLTVTDNSKATATSSATVAVVAPPPPDQPPLASFTSSCTGRTCTFTDASTDDGTVAAWAWDFGDNQGASTLRHPTYSYAADGTYSVTLNVTDNTGTSSSVTRSVTVSNTPPTAAFTSSCSALSCSFADASSDTDGTVATWSWEFGDGDSSTLQNPSHNFGAAGDYQVTLTVTDDAGAPGSVTQTVSTTDPPTP
jgi:PKD repeat protein